MAIRILDNKIEIGSFSLEESDTGLKFDGTARFLSTFVREGFQGTISGYTSGGAINVPPTSVNTIDKFPFATNASASDVGDLSANRRDSAGQSSTVSGYTSGGASSNVIDKFPFATDGNATDVGDLSQGRYRAASQSSTVSGYTSGGAFPSVNTIDKFPFAADANATDVGDLTQARYGAAGQSSTVSGYSSGGVTPPASNVIDKFPFASNANASDVGDLTQIRWEVTGQSSTVSGYTSGGENNGVSPPLINTIDKFPFASNANATDVGDLTQGRARIAGQSSTASGYTSGGYNINPPEVIYNTIDKFPFASDASATDVGDLSQTRRSAAGQQV
jgi:hypothetical protein